MKRLETVLSIVGSILGFIWMLGPPSFQVIGRGIFIALLVVLGIAGAAGIIILYLVAKSQLAPPYG